MLTLPYAAPEVVQAVVDGRRLPAETSADCWALGVLAYEMLTQQHWVSSEASTETVCFFLYPRVLCFAHVLGLPPLEAQCDAPNTIELQIANHVGNLQVLDCLLERNNARLPALQYLHSRAVREHYGCMHGPLAGLLHRDPKRRSACHDVVRAFDTMLGNISVMTAVPSPVSSTIRSAGCKRAALVIGNNEYDCDCYHSLRAPKHDALRMKQELHSRGFKVSVELDLASSGVMRAVHGFVEQFRQRQCKPGAPSEVCRCINTPFCADSISSGCLSTLKSRKLGAVVSVSYIAGV